MRALAYDIEVKYLNGKEIYLADALSRAHLPRTSYCGQEEFETINGLSHFPKNHEREGDAQDHIFPRKMAPAHVWLSCDHVLRS